MKKGCILFLMLVLVAALAACTGIPPAGEENGTAHSELLIAYDSQEGIIQETAALLQETLGGDLYAIEEGASGDFTPYEFVLLGFSAESSNLPQTIQSFLLSNSFGAKTIYPFVFGEGNEASAIFSVLARRQRFAVHRGYKRGGNHRMGAGPGTFGPPVSARIPRQHGFHCVGNARSAAGAVSVGQGQYASRNGIYR